MKSCWRRRPAEVEPLAELLRAAMREALPLVVPLEVEVKARPELARRVAAGRGHPGGDAAEIEE